MKQRTALFAAVALTAFVLVLAGGIIGALTQPVPAAPAVLSTEDQSLTTNSQSPALAPAGAQTSYAVSAQQASKIALTTVSGATLTQTPQLVNLQGTAAYEVVLDRGTLYVDAQSGQVLSDTTSNPATTSVQPGNGSYEYEGYEHEEGEHEYEGYEHEHEEGEE